MQTFEKIQFQVGAWSLKNFNGQETPYLNVRFAGEVRDCARNKGDAPGPAWDALHSEALVVSLGGLAPLMGLVEEVGELCGAKSRTDAQDALGDIAIYLCDYLCRENIQWPTRIELPVEQQYTAAPVTGIVVCLGALHHCHLKRFQRIRGMHDLKAFEAKRMEALHGLVWHMELVAENANDDLLTLLNHTWNTIVNKRDWKKDAGGGGGHTHTAAPVLNPAPVADPRVDTTELH